MNNLKTLKSRSAQATVLPVTYSFNNVVALDLSLFRSRIVRRHQETRMKEVEGVHRDADWHPFEKIEAQFSGAAPAARELS